MRSLKVGNYMIRKLIIIAAMFVTGSTVTGFTQTGTCTCRDTNEYGVTRKQCQKLCPGNNYAFTPSNLTRRMRS